MVSSLHLQFHCALLRLGDTHRRRPCRFVGMASPRAHPDQKVARMARICRADDVRAQDFFWVAILTINPNVLRQGQHIDATLAARAAIAHRRQAKTFFEHGKGACLFHAFFTQKFIKHMAPPAFKWHECHFETFQISDFRALSFPIPRHFAPVRPSCAMPAWGLPRPHEPIRPGHLWPLQNSTKDHAGSVSPGHLRLRVPGNGAGPAGHMAGILRAPSSGNPHRPPGRSFLRIARGRFPVLQESATFDFLLLPQWRCDKEFSNAVDDRPWPVASMDAHLGGSVLGGSVNERWPERHCTRDKKSPPPLSRQGVLRIPDQSAISQSNDCAASLRLALTPNHWLYRRFSGLRARAW